MEARRGGGPKGGGPKGEAQNFLLFFLPLPFSLSFSLSGSLVVEFWWCLKRRDPQMAASGGGVPAEGGPEEGGKGDPAEGGQSCAPMIPRVPGHISEMTPRTERKNKSEVNSP